MGPLTDPLTGSSVMPFALIAVLLDIATIFHAAQTGRLRPWAFIILAVPFVGSLAYICVELVPEFFGSPDVRRARKRVASKLDPDKQYRELSDQLAISDTVANRAALAAECTEVARFDEAERHYDHILKLPMGDDPKYALGKAQAQFSAKRFADALATLDHLQKHWPDFESPEGHLLYARTLAELGRVDQALEEFHAVSDYFPGAEATVRYGLLLKTVGRTAEARVILNELLIKMRGAPRYLRKAQAEWLSIAEKQLST
jgi:hypothetical protein